MNLLVWCIAEPISVLVVQGDFAEDDTLGLPYSSVAAVVIPTRYVNYTGQDRTGVEDARLEESDRDRKRRDLFAQFIGRQGGKIDPSMAKFVWLKVRHPALPPKY